MTFVSLFTEQFPTFWPVLALTSAEMALYFGLTDVFSKNPMYYFSYASGLGGDWVSWRFWATTLAWLFSVRKFYFAQIWTFFTKRGNFFCPPKLTCAPDEIFNGDYDSAIKHGLTTWFHKVMAEGGCLLCFEPPESVLYLKCHTLAPSRTFASQDCNAAAASLSDISFSTKLIDRILLLPNKNAPAEYRSNTFNNFSIYNFILSCQFLNWIGSVCTSVSN